MSNEAILGKLKEAIEKLKSGELKMDDLPADGTTLPSVVTHADLAEIAQSHILGGKPVERLRYEPGVKGANKTKDAH